MDAAQALCLRRSGILYERFPAVDQTVVPPGTGRKRKIEIFHDPGSECPILRENPPRNLRDLIPPGSPAVNVVHLNRRALKALYSGIAIVDWFRTQKDSVATGAGKSLAIPPAR